MPIDTLDDLRRFMAETPMPTGPTSPLVDRLGLSPYAPRADERIDFKQGVRASGELDRIVALPRRAPQWGKELAAQVSALTMRERPLCPCKQFAGGLLPLQAAALVEAPQVGGLLGLLPAGGGKCLVSLLLPVPVLWYTYGANARTVLLVPANLREQTIREYGHLARHFYLPHLVSGGELFDGSRGELHLHTYHDLSNHRKCTFLERINPHMVILDEGHELRHQDNAKFRVFRDFMLGAQKRGHRVALAVLSGTITKKTLMDCIHLVAAALGSGSPMPTEYDVAKEWAAAIDPSDDPAPMGELIRLCAPGETARNGFQRRLRETIGVISSEADDIPNSLVIDRRDIQTPPEIEAHLFNLRENWALPDGDFFEDALTYTRAVRQLAQGLYYKWIWPRGEPPAVRAAWMEARKEWHKELRYQLLYRHQMGLHTPQLLTWAAERDRLFKAAVWGGNPALADQIRESGPMWESAHYARWKEVEHTAQPQTQVFWVSDFLVKDATAWGLGANKRGGGIIWYESSAFGAAVARAGGFPLLGGGEDADRQIAEENDRAKAGKGRTIVVSLKAHRQGKNLQGYHDQLITAPPSDGADLEQLLARTHRRGNDADVITARFYLHTQEYMWAFESAARYSKYIQETTGKRQRLSIASLTFPFER